MFAPTLAVLDETYGVAPWSTASSFFLCHRIRCLGVRLFVFFFFMFSRAICFFLVWRFSIFHIPSSLAPPPPASFVSSHSARQISSWAQTYSNATPPPDLTSELLSCMRPCLCPCLPPGCIPPPPSPKGIASSTRVPRMLASFAVTQFQAPPPLSPRSATAPVSVQLQPLQKKYNNNNPQAKPASLPAFLQQRLNRVIAGTYKRRLHAACTLHGQTSVLPSTSPFPPRLSPKVFSFSRGSISVRAAFDLHMPACPGHPSLHSLANAYVSFGRRHLSRDCFLTKEKKYKPNQNKTKQNKSNVVHVSRAPACPIRDVAH
eukprot:Rhum_TRINITY_DN15170_c8_g1::Rhum_TRINITY_DN15170_c8_g1_i1::g.141155::m.141155